MKEDKAVTRQSLIEKICEPVVARWALSRLENLTKRDPVRARKFESEVFNDIAIRRMFDCQDASALTSIFRTLEAELFSSVVSEMKRRWRDWEEIVAYHAAPIIAKLNPEGFVEAAESFIGSARFRIDINKTFGTIKGLDLIESDIATKKIRRITQNFTSDPRGLEVFLDILLQASIRRRLQEAWDLIKWGIDTIKKSERIVGFLSKIYGIITKEAPFFSFILAKKKGWTTVTFLELERFFHKDAPLKDLDRLVKAPCSGFFTAVKSLLPSQLEEISDFSPLSFAGRFISAFDLSDKMYDSYSAFVLSLIAAGHSRTFYDWSSESIESTIALLSLDLQTIPGFQSLVQNLKSADPQKVVGPIVEAFEKTGDSYGSCHLAKCMGEMGFDEFIQPLIDATGKNKGDYLCEDAAESLARIGESAINKIIEQWEYLDSSQKIYCFGVMKHMDYEPVIDFLITHFEESRSKDLEQWCGVAQTIPDVRLIDVLERELKRGQTFIDSTYLTLCELLSIERPGIETIRLRYDKRQKEICSRTKAFYEGTLEDLERDYLRLKLMCPLCGDENVYDVRNVFIYPEAKDEEPFIGDDLTCLSCGKITEMKITGEGHLMILAEIIKLGAAKEKGVEIKSPVKPVSLEIADGIVASIGKSIEIYEEKLENDPDNPEYLLSLGNIYLRVNKRRDALTYFFRCVSVDPKCAEAWWTIAKMYESSCNLKESLRYLEKGLAFQHSWRFYRLEGVTPGEFRDEYLRFYDELRNSPGTEIESMIHPSFLKRRKVGRNEPCPCGSGEKYKKCCIDK